MLQMSRVVACKNHISGYGCFQVLVTVEASQNDCSSILNNPPLAARSQVHPHCFIVTYPNAYVQTGLINRNHHNKVTLHLRTYRAGECLFKLKRVNRFCWPRASEVISFPEWRMRTGSGIAHTHSRFHFLKVVLRSLGYNIIRDFRYIDIEGAGSSTALL